MKLYSNLSWTPVHSRACVGFRAPGIRSTQLSILALGCMTMGKLSFFCIYLLISHAGRTQTILGLLGRFAETTDVGIVILTNLASPGM